MKSKKLWILLAIVTILAFTLIGCSDSKDTTTETETPVTDGTNSNGYIKIAELDDVKTWDPGLNAAANGGAIIAHTGDGLARLDENNQVVLASAASIVPNDDATVYTITLRDDLKWSNGEPITTKDYKDSWIRVLDPETASEYVAIMGPYIKNGLAFNAGEVSADEVGINIIDDLTMEVMLEAPCAFFDQLLTFYTYKPVYMPTVTENGEGWEKNPATFVGDGPYVLEEYKPNEKIVLKKNDMYYDAANITMPGIEFIVLTDASTAMNAYNDNQVQVNKNVSSEQQKELLATDPDFKVVPQVGTYYYAFNVDTAPFDDVNVRKAFALAVDRTDLVTNILTLQQKPAIGFVPDSLTYSDESTGNEKLSLLSADPQIEKAKEYLAAAGYPDGAGFPVVTIKYNTSEGHKKIAEAVQEQIKNNLGIDIKLENSEWAVFQDTRANGDFQIARHGWLGDFNDPSTMLDVFISVSGNNDTQWRTNEFRHDNKLNPEAAEFDAYVAQYQSLPAGPERDEALKNAEYEIIDDNMILLPLYQYTTYNYVKSSVIEGVEYSPLDGYFFGHTSFIN